jgi:tetratricopeptide (TPR) repeat protein
MSCHHALRVTTTSRWLQPARSAGCRVHGDASLALRALFVVVLPALSLAFCGCVSTQSQARKQANERWSQVRAGVKARLAADQLAAGHIEDAAAELAAALRLDPANPELLTLQARVCLARGELAAAEKLLSGVQKSGRQGAEIDYLLGVVHEQRLQWLAAREFFARAADQDPQELAYAVAYVHVMLQLDRAEEALLFLRSREDRFGWTSGYHAARAECCERLGDWAGAVSAWQKVVDADRDPGVRERLAMALFHAGRWPEALRQFEQLLVENDQPLAAPLRLALAECLLEDGQAAAAHEQLGVLLRDDPRNVAALRLVARAFAQQEHFERARQSAEQALRLAPDDPRTLELAAALAFRTGDMKRASSLARRILQSSPEADSPVARQILDHLSAAPSALE